MVEIGAHILQRELIELTPGLVLPLLFYTEEDQRRGEVENRDQPVSVHRRRKEHVGIISLCEREERERKKGRETQREKR